MFDFGLVVSFWGFVWKVFWLLLPAGFANMAPIFAKKLIPHWHKPIDLNLTWRGQRIFGDHKTYRGIFSGMILGGLIFYGQHQLALNSLRVQSWSFFDISAVNVLWGAWMGLSALLGDLIKSFFKRRKAVAPGESWMPFDQIDWVLGLLIGIVPLYRPTLAIIIMSLIIGLFEHFLIRSIGYVSKINDTFL